METRERRASRIEARPWHDVDRYELRRLNNDGYDSIAISRKMSRSREDVLAEIERMGLNAEYEDDPMEVPKTMRPCLSCGKEFLSRVGHVCGRCKERGEFQSSASDTFTDLNLRRGRM